MKSGGLALRQCEISYSIVRGFRGGRKCTASGLNKSGALCPNKGEILQISSGGESKISNADKITKPRIANFAKFSAHLPL